MNQNKIKDISVLEYVKFEKLQVLNLSDNLINNIKVFEKVDFDELLELWLFNNQISNLNSIKDLKIGKIEILSLFGNNSIKSKFARSNMKKMTTIRDFQFKNSNF